MLVAQNWLSRLLRGVNPSWDGVSAEEMDAAFVRVGFETEGFEPIPRNHWSASDRPGGVD